MMDWSKKAIIGMIGVLGILGGCAANQRTSDAYSSNNKPAMPSAVKQDQNAVGYLSKLTYHSGENPIVTVNNGIPAINMDDWHENKVEYQPLDRLNRTSSAVTAYLEPANVADDQLRVRQTFIPTGWHQKRNQQGQPILNRGHLIAYSLTKGITTSGQFNSSQLAGNQNDPRNLFTQTAFCNQKLQTIYEQKVRVALRQGAKVIYVVQPVFDGDDLMPKGVHLMAKATNGMQFNVYLFNVQPGFRFNYTTGRSVADRTMRVPTPLNAPHRW